MQDLQSENRECPFSLVEKLKGDLSDAELKSVLSCIDENDDFRIEQPLLAVLEDLNLTEAVRERASWALCSINTHDTLSQRADWWASGDNILMRHALRVSEAEETALVETVASDWSSPFQSEAIDVLPYHNRALHSQQIRIDALSHPAPFVRKVAAKSLMWDQPVCAETALLRALNDESDEVVCEVAATLCWYTSQYVLVALDKSRRECKPELFDCLNDAFNWVFSETLAYDVGLESDDVNRQAGTSYRKWLGRLDKIFCWMTWTDSDARKVKSGLWKSARDAQKHRRVSANEIIELYSDFNKRRPFFGHGPYDWNYCSEEERRTLTAFFMATPDHLVREISIQAFVEWNDSARLKLLIYDPAHRVRRSACYNAKFLSPDIRIQEALLETLNHIGTSDSFASETLESFVVHAGQNEKFLFDILENLIRSDRREMVRMGSLEHICKLKPEKLNDFLYILDEPPLETWAMHQTILRLCVDHNLVGQNLDRLNYIDDFIVQQNLALLNAMQ